MKLSEAIRIGASKTQKARQMYINRAGTATCAIGAALYAHGYTTEEAIMDADIGEVLELGGYKRFIHPVTGEVRYGIFGVVTELNDFYGWSRKRIAKWLESEGL